VYGVLVRPVTGPFIYGSYTQAESAIDKMRTRLESEYENKYQDEFGYPVPRTAAKKGRSWLLGFKTYSHCPRALKFSNLWDVETIFQKHRDSAHRYERAWNIIAH
jgi:hypothetical protein